MAKSIGGKIVKRLGAFTESLEKNETITERYTCRTISLDLEPKGYNPVLVKQTREILGLSQALFALFLGVAKSTICAWEQGDKKPQPIACRFMDEIRRAPDHWRARVQEIARSKSGVK